LQRQGLAEIPEQFVQLAHVREHGEHLRRRLRRAPPVASTESALRDVLSRAEAVVDRATPKASLAQVGVNATPEVPVQVGTRLPRRLVDGEVRGRGERRRDAAQPEATRAVGTQAELFPGRHLAQLSETASSSR
jgi:hypothetical protein